MGLNQVLEDTLGYASFQKPRFKLEINNKDVTATIQERLISFALIDNDGWESDSLNIMLDNRNNAIPLPKYEEPVRLWLGYNSSLIYMGLFKVTDSSISFRPRTLSISCLAADLTKASLKAAKTRGWDNQTLKQILDKIAGEHQLKPVISAELASIIYPQVDQNKESDVNLLSRLAQEFDATLKVANGFLIMAVRGDGKSTTGQNLPEVTLNEWDLQPGASIRTIHREKAKSVKCEYREVATGEATFYTAGSGEPALTLKGLAPNLAQAKARAEIKLQAQSRQELEISFTTAKGDPRLLSGTPIVLGKGFHPAYDGKKFIIESANHNYDGSYITSCTGKLKL